MKFRLFASILFIVLMLASATGLSAKQTMAFGYLANSSKDQNYDYLETIFPNSFANSMKNIFNVNVVKPHSLREKLSKKKVKLKKYYNPWELPELMEKTKTDLFIYGRFTPMPDNQIEIVMHLYAEGSNMLFTFTNIGRMETEIFRLVDRITVILLNFMVNDNLYLSRTIQKGSRLAFITDISGEHLNSFYYPFLEKGFRLSCTQGNSLYNRFDEDDISPFYNIKTRNNSYDSITDRRKVRFLYGTWAGKPYSDDLTVMRRTYIENDLNFLKTKEKTLDSMGKALEGNVDYLIIVGFRKNRKKAWVRCIDVKSRDLVWMQTEIEGSSEREVAEKMIERMTTPVKDPFREKIEKYK